MELTIRMTTEDLCVDSKHLTALWTDLTAISRASIAMKNESSRKLGEMADKLAEDFNAKSPVNAPKASETTKVSENEETTAKNGSDKATEANTKKTEPVTEPKKEEPTPAPAEGQKTEEAESPETSEKVDRDSIVARVKQIAFEGKAEGKPKKIKALLQEYGVEKLPDLADEKLGEFLQKVEAL